jgi:hypothetical protein
MLIGPEPTTDRFHVISYGKEEGKVRIKIFLSICSSVFRGLLVYLGGPIAP